MMPAAPQTSALSTHALKRSLTTLTPKVRAASTSSALARSCTPSWLSRKTRATTIAATATAIAVGRPMTTGMPKKACAPLNRSV